jgi:signal transduction histidine kinase
MVKKSLIVFFSFIMALCFAGNGFAETLTAKLCKEKATAAAKLLEQKGEGAFEALKDPNGEFRFGDGQGYVWVQDLDAKMLMHPIKPSLDGKALSGVKDSNGVLFFVAFSETAEDEGAGWVGYLWPKPGEKAVSPKVSYVVLAKHGDTSFVVGSGIYDVTPEDIKKEFPEDFVYED